ncbi:unnamed protein product [Adineta steineri]|uniref:G-protein coupled receptors family 1 profile domain-containing protein n=1 Tax=Adineta steineri TaxID=433720 RepID=A0A818VAC6_9BILA|nr:unnamed protein product [Adineta steineri]CAF3704082.1 unnamed protein product [Adineta steineri]
MTTSLLQIGEQLTRAIIPVIIVIGVVGNSLNIAVLARRALYHHACSRYFLAVAINNLLFSGIFLTYRLSVNGYQDDLANYTGISCKIITYIATVSSFISPYLIVFASVDRYCASSANAQIRRLSSVRISKWIICTVISVFALFFIHILVLFDLQPAFGFICALQINIIYNQIYITAQVFLYALFAPGFMMIFGLMTIRNTTRARVVPIATSRFNRTEHQLARMLFLQVSVYILLTLPSSIIYLISILSNTISSGITFSFSATVCQLLFDFSYGSSFFLYLLSSHTYRKELMLLVRKTLRIRCSNQVERLDTNNVNLPVAVSAYPQSTA